VSTAYLGILHPRRDSPVLDRPATLQDILAQSRTLSPRQRVRLIERLAADLEGEVGLNDSEERSLLGLWSDLDPAPSDAILEQARHDMWATFPRDDIVDQEG
jgi:hypothetical protein